MAAEDLYFGFNPPFIGGAQNVLSQQRGERLIKNDLLQSYLTVPGERVFRPDFGTIVKAAVFDPNDVFTTDRIRSDIIRMTRLDERVEIQTVSVNNEVDEGIIRIKVVVTPNDEPLVNYVIEINQQIATALPPGQAEREFISETNQALSDIVAGI